MNATHEYGATLLRTSLGVMYLAHAGLKLFVFGMPAAAEFFAAQGFPAWSAYAVVAAEGVGGLMLIGGIYARWVALALLPILLGALKVHLGNGWVFTAPGGGWEYPLLLAVLSVVQALVGDGAWALRRSPALSGNFRRSGPHPA